MPYRLKARESIPENIRRIVTEEIDSALGQLRERSIGKRDEAIHEARKSIKKIRGVLKLMRPELGVTYDTENESLRNIGAKLSELRDAGAMIETLGSLIGSYSEKLQKKTLSAIRRGLELDKREKEKSLRPAKAMQEAAAGLMSFRKRVSKWPLSSDGFGAIAAGLQQTYRDGRKAMANANRKKTPELYHEWRKRAKDHWYHIRLLESLWTEVMEARESSLHDLETWLGEDHNLVVLQERMKANPGRFGSEKDIALVRALADDHQNDLRRNSSLSGQRLYEEKPKQFVRGMRKLWDAWIAHPGRMKRLKQQGAA